jgi:hypothetical protein
MKANALTVLMRDKDSLIHAELKFDANGQPFAVLHEWLKKGKHLFNDGIKLNPALLKKVPNRDLFKADYIYEGTITLPDDTQN